MFYIVFTRMFLFTVKGLIAKLENNITKDVVDDNRRYDEGNFPVCFCSVLSFFVWFLSFRVSTLFESLFISWHILVDGFTLSHLNNI